MQRLNCTFARDTDDKSYYDSLTDGWGDDGKVLVVIGCGLTPVKILFRLRLQKICTRRNTTTTCKGSTHGLTYKMNVYIKFNKKIFISKN